MANKKLTPLERIKSVTNLAVEYKFPVTKVMDVYNTFNYQVYNNYLSHGGGVRSDNSVFEDIAFKFTKVFLNLLN